MNKLADIAATAIGATRCDKIEKCPDGLYNKAYIFTMDNGKEVIGKVPNPNATTQATGETDHNQPAGLPFLTTWHVSGYRTLDFYQQQLMVVLEYAIPLTHNLN